MNEAMRRKWSTETVPVRPGSRLRCQVPSCAALAVVATRYSNGRRVRHCDEHAGERRTAAAKVSR